MKKILIVGCGLSGSIIARQLAEKDYLVTIIDKRDHIAGNMFDYTKENILIHKYGPHIWHTNNEVAHNYMGQFTNWIEYNHKVKAILEDGTYVTLPVNKETKKIVGEENIIDIFFRPYTKKMWNKDIEELNPEILKRVPIRDDMNELYFPDDKYQAMPDKGYTELFTKLLDHDNIQIVLDMEYSDIDKEFYHTFNSMPIDEYFDFEHGMLPYRAIKFHDVLLPSPNILPTACVNYTNTTPYTRMTEWKMFPNSPKSDYTIITYEEPCDFKETNERYYPVKDSEGENNKLYRKYKAQIPSNMTFIGRCGLYKYLDMDDITALSLQQADKFLSLN